MILSGMNVLDEIAESRIQEAVQRGDFDNLANAGKPLHLDSDPFIPEEMRMAYKILKNAGYLPPEISLRNDIADAEATLSCATDNDVRKKTLKKLQCLFLKLDEMRQRQVSLVLQQDYYEKLLNRLSGI